ncbi:hypothetical protein RMATCC62417_01270 [Rhizopus microsporus]|nr:hypothetical protein RMATCC62417_01270 [Rhizopus microsporus]
MDKVHLIRKDIVALLCDFLEVWFHQILYYRNLYPRKVFEQRKKFQAPVYIAIHPEIQKYISQFVQSCYPLLEEGDIRCINLTVKNEKDDSIIEKVVFEIKSVLKHVDIPLSKVASFKSLLVETKCNSFSLE